MGWMAALKAQTTTFLGRLRRDARGNTLAIMAAALIPLIAFSGSAVDMARLYVVKVRLQQSCDAGVLAARHAMTDNSMSTPLANTPAADQAQAFFTNNFRSGWYQNTNVVFTPVKASQGASTVANAVTGTATATVPMALMQYFGAPAITLNVTCQAVYDLADTDIMFVLDTTGSMSCYPSDPDSCATASTTFPQSDPSNPNPSPNAYFSPEKPPTNDSSGNPMYSKLESLRQAVLLFDSTMRANADSSTHFRYGFAPYSSAVNIGKSIPAQYLQSGTWQYQSRQVSGDYSFGSTSSFNITNIPQSYCVAQRYPATGYSTSGPTWNTISPQAEYYSGLTWTSPNGGTCSGTQQPLRAMWSYQQWPLDISQYVTGAAVPNTTRLDSSTSKWRGCIEEVDTSPATSFNVSSLPDDLNPDFAPSSATDKWRPMWPDVEWLRDTTGQQSVKDESINEISPHSYTDVSYRFNSYYGAAATCGMAAQRLQTMTAQQVHDYVYHNDFRPSGGTYHDVGMIWGTRMLSPNGIFASDTAPWPGRNPPSRSIVFMTDGGMAPQPIIYGQYGVETFDLRIDGSSGNLGSYSDYDKARHLARFQVECDAAKARGITIYVVALGTTITSDLNYCASPGQAFQASSTTALTAAFKTIAQRVAKLRITL